MNTRNILIGVGAFIILVIIVLVLRNVAGNGFSLLGGSKVSIDNQTFNVTVAKTEADREKGLSGKSSLASDRGMLFTFDTPGIYPFWMHGMKFPLDIIFINGNKIVTIARNASADQTKLSYIYPTAPIDKVLEINAGLSQKYNFHEGDTVTTSGL